MAVYAVNHSLQTWSETEMINVTKRTEMMQAPSSTTLRQPWLNLARAAWIVLTLTAVLTLIAGTVILLREPLPTCATPEISCGPWAVSQEDMALAAQLGLPVTLMMTAYFVNGFLPKLFFLLVGLLIFWRRSDDWVALLLSLMLVGFMIEGVQNLGSFMPFVNGLYGFITAVFVLLPFIFPNGRIVPTKIRWLVPPIVVLTTSSTFLPQLGLSSNDQLFALVTMATFFVWFLVGGYAAVYRYKYVSTSVERQQTKWVMAGILGTFVLFIPFTIIGVYYPPSQPSPERLTFVFLVYLPIGLISYLFIPASIGVAILRYRLYDIDLIIRRTLQYTLLTGLMALVYWGSVVLLQGLFTAILGEQTAVSIVLSTLLLAALFTPLRQRVQAMIDRRFYRKKYDTQQILAQFAQTAQNETDMEALQAELLRVVQETIQPEYGAIWLKPAASSRFSVDS
jgi:hypothetical protein